MAATPASRKTANPGPSGPINSLGTVAITAAPARPKSVSATARVEKRSSMSARSSLRLSLVGISASYRCYQCGADAFEFSLECVQEFGGARQLAGAAACLYFAADLRHVHCSHVA